LKTELTAFQAKERPARQVEEKQKRIEFLEKKVQTKDEVLAELMCRMMCGIRWGILSDAGRRRPRSASDDFPRWLGIGASKFYDWRQRYGRVNEHNGWIPPDFLAGAVGEGSDHRLPLEESVEGYRRLTFMMLERSGCDRVRIRCFSGYVICLSVYMFTRVIVDCCCDSA
jgi:hypothetical protein